MMASWGDYFQFLLKLGKICGLSTKEENLDTHKISETLCNANFSIRSDWKFRKSHNQPYLEHVDLHYNFLFTDHPKNPFLSSHEPTEEIVSLPVENEVLTEEKVILPAKTEILLEENEILPAEIEAITTIAPLVLTTSSTKEGDS